MSAPRNPFGTPEPGVSGPYQDGNISNPDLQDYYDATGIPPPHRFQSNSSSPYPTTPIPSASASAVSSRTAPDSATRGAYAPPVAQPSMSNYYNNIDNGTSQPFAFSEKPRASSRRKWIIGGSIIALIVIIAVGVGVGVSVSNNNKKDSSNRSASSGSGSGSAQSNSSSPVKQTNPNDPSTFVKDSRLKQSFYGLAYTPAGSQLPDCGNSLQDVIQDIQLISQLTTRIRLYGADCNQSALVLEAVKQTKVNLTVWLGNYPTPTDGTAYTRQRDSITQAIQTYGTDHIGGVTVGNEWMLNYLNANGATDPNSAIGNQGGQLLITDIQDTVSVLQGMNLDKHIPVGTADAGAFFNTEVLSAVEYGMSNVHAWFANVSIDQAAAWTNEFFQEQNVQPASLLSNRPKMYIAETGWPSNSSDAGNESNGLSTASIPNLQEFINTFVCQANTNGTGYFFFEFFDETWKDVQFGGVEGWWGLFTPNKTLKPIEIPDCPSP